MSERGISPDEMRAYILGVRQEGSMPSGRAGHGETEHLSSGRCYDCNRRGHSTMDCPGIVEEKPVIRRLVWTYPAERLDRED